MSGMRRPASRGFGASSGGGAGRPASGRLGTGSMRTGMQSGVPDGVNYGGVGLNTQVAVSARPVTQQGMAGVRTASGRGRQVQDISFHLAQLRKRVGEISSEIRRMHQEHGQLQKDSSTHDTLQRRYDDCIKDVRNLEGELADYNLAMDKARTSVDPAEVARFQAQLAAHNKESERQIDQIFVERQEREQGVQRLETQIRELQAMAEQRLSSLPADQLAEYKKMVAGNRAMSDKIMHMQGQLEGLNADIGHAESQLSQDVHREEVALLERKLSHLQDEQRELHEELSSAALNPADARAKLLAKVKTDNQHIKELDGKLREVQAAVAAAKGTAAELSSDVQRRSADGSEGQKLEALFAKDQEMTQFIDSFPSAKAKEAAEQQRAQDTVVALLEHISAEVGREAELPSLHEAEALKGELKEKQTELERSKATKERLRSELVTRQGELKRLETLEGKIAVEIKSLRDNIGSMKGDMAHLQDVDGLQEASDAAQESLSGLLTRYSARADSLRHVVAEATRKQDELASQLEHNPTASALVAQEARMKHFEQSIFNMRQYIESQGRDADYSGVREEVLGLSHKLNGLVTEVQTTTAPSMSAAPY